MRIRHPWRDRDRGVPPAGTVRQQVQRSHPRQGHGAGGDPWPQAIQDRQRGAAFEQEGQVSEVPGKRHLEQLPPLEMRNGVDPPARAAPVQPLPEKPQRQREPEEPRHHSALARAPGLQRREQPGRVVSPPRQPGLAERPEEDPRQREGCAGKGQRERQRGEAEREEKGRLPRCGTGRSDAGLDAGRQQGGAEPHRREHGGEAEGAEGSSGERRAGKACVPPVVQPQVEQLEQVPEHHAGGRAGHPIAQARQGRSSVAQAHGAVER